MTYIYIFISIHTFQHREFISFFGYNFICCVPFKPCERQKGVSPDSGSTSGESNPDRPDSMDHEIDDRIIAQAARR